ncbi:universal stress protein [Desulfosporosinus sp. PR]|uniref:universal stress protein n=1 Tax=Candidatus Desulfosporosinus nitrosoreducens TaxID=3401928 RepID=UPI0027F7A4BE|nr:universal stress protein [Desulfosporosinus sp. PR]MDQ7095627.1 universal stress protein [Desulfosporosinus sp. PR]
MSAKFKVLLYSDGSHQAFSAAVYTATLLQNMPGMYLTVLHIHDRDEALEGEYSWIHTWPTEPTTEWVKHVLNESNSELQKEYNAILFKTNDLFSNRKYKVYHQELFSNTRLSEISDTADLILDYAARNSFDLIVMGTRGHSNLQGLIFGSLAHTVLTRSSIPVMLIKKLPQEFIDRYLSGTKQTFLRRIK